VARLEEHMAAAVLELPDEIFGERTEAG